jgi:hypothetical protein
MNATWKRFCLTLLGAAAGLQMAGCESDITQTFESAFECVESPCAVSFENLQPRRAKTAEVTIRSVGDAPLEITSITFESGSDKIRYSDQMIVALSRFGWEQAPFDAAKPELRTWVDSDGNATGEGTAIVLEPETFITLGLTITPTAAGDTGCPNDGTGNCGTILIKTTAREMFRWTRRAADRSFRPLRSTSRPLLPASPSSAS